MYCLAREMYLERVPRDAELELLKSFSEGYKLPHRVLFTRSPLNRSAGEITDCGTCACHSKCDTKTMDSLQWDVYS